MNVIDNNGNGLADTWKALKAAAQDPNPEDITSNTQWSIAYDLDKLECEMTLRRHWNKIMRIRMLEPILCIRMYGLRMKPDSM